jgi:hypothetical protein
MKTFIICLAVLYVISIVITVICIKKAPLLPPDAEF